MSPSNTTLSVAEDDPPVAQFRDLLRGVADEDDRASLFAELGDALHALALERLVADRQDLVDEEDVGIGVDGDGERQPHVHARGVELHGRVDEVADAAEGDDRVELRVDLRTASAPGSTR